MQPKIGLNTVDGKRCKTSLRQSVLWRQCMYGVEFNTFHIFTKEVMFLTLTFIFLKTKSLLPLQEGIRLLAKPTFIILMTNGALICLNKKTGVEEIQM